MSINITDVLQRITYDHIAQTYNNETSLYKCLCNLSLEFGQMQFAQQMQFVIDMQQLITSTHFNHPQDNVYFVPDYQPLSDKQYLYVTVNMNTGYAKVTDDFDEEVAAINIAHLHKMSDGNIEQMRSGIKSLMVDTGLATPSDIITFDEYIDESGNSTSY